MPTRDVLYARISEDELGLAKGVERQLEDGRELSARTGATVVAERSDNDVSASKGAHRAGYSAVLDDVRAGRVDRIVVFQTSRLWRNRVERAAGIELLARHRVSVVAVKGPSLDLSTAYGRGMAGLLGEFDTMESEVKSERVQRAAQQRADEGRRNGALPYGWRVEGGRDVIDDAEAAIVREVVDRLLAGDSLNALVADLNARGVPSPQQRGPWLTSSVRKLALRESNAARRVHQGRVVTCKTDSGRAAWPALVDDDRHDRVVALLSDPARRYSRDGQRRHLLTYGIGECGICDGRLRAVTKRLTRRVARSATPDNPDGIVRTDHELYVCDASGCVGRARVRVDELLDEVVVERLSRPDAADLVRGNDAAAADVAARLAALRGRLDNAADDYAEGLIDREQLHRVTAKLRPQLQLVEAEARQAAAPHRELVESLLGGEVAERWGALPLSRKRAALELLGVRVRILPTRKGAGFDPRSVDVRFGVARADDTAEVIPSGQVELEELGRA